MFVRVFNKLIAYTDGGGIYFDGREVDDTSELLVGDAVLHIREHGGKTNYTAHSVSSVNNNYLWISNSEDKFSRATGELSRRRAKSSPSVKIVPLGK